MYSTGTVAPPHARQMLRNNDMDLTCTAQVPRPRLTNLLALWWKRQDEFPTPEPPWRPRFEAATPLHAVRLDISGVNSDGQTKVLTCPLYVENMNPA